MKSFPCRVWGDIQNPKEQPALGRSKTRPPYFIKSQLSSSSPEAFLVNEHSSYCKRLNANETISSIIWCILFLIYWPVTVFQEKKVAKNKGGHLTHTFAVLISRGRTRVHAKPQANKMSQRILLIDDMSVTTQRKNTSICGKSHFPQR